MRIRVPQKVFEGLEHQRRTHGVMSFLNPQLVAANLVLWEMPEAADWVLEHQDEVTEGTTRGFISEETPIPPEPVRERDDGD